MANQKCKICDGNLFDVGSIQCGAIHEQYRDASKTLETLPEDKFQAFFQSLPARVQLLVRGGLVDWREVLPQWYIKLLL